MIDFKIHAKKAKMQKKTKKKGINAKKAEYACLISKIMQKGQKCIFNKNVVFILYRFDLNYFAWRKFSQIRIEIIFF